MRRSFDVLAEHVRVVLAEDPESGHLFVFRNRNSQRVKILWWDQNGYAIYYKRLSRGTFAFPSSAENSVEGKPSTSEGKPSSLTIDSAQLMKLLSGCAIR